MMTAGTMTCGEVSPIFPSLCGAEMGIQQYVDGKWVSVADALNGKPINPGSGARRGFLDLHDRAGSNSGTAPRRREAWPWHARRRFVASPLGAAIGVADGCGPRTDRLPRPRSPARSAAARWSLPSPSDWSSPTDRRVSSTSPMPPRRHTARTCSWDCDARASCSSRRFPTRSLCSRACCTPSGFSQVALPDWPTSLSFGAPLTFGAAFALSLVIAALAGTAHAPPRVPAAAPRATAGQDRRLGRAAAGAPVGRRPALQLAGCCRQAAVREASRPPPRHVVRARPADPRRTRGRGHGGPLGGVSLHSLRAGDTRRCGGREGRRAHRALARAARRGELGDLRRARGGGRDPGRDDERVDRPDDDHAADRSRPRRCARRRPLLLRRHRRRGVRDRRRLRRCCSSSPATDVVVPTGGWCADARAQGSTAAARHHRGALRRAATGFRRVAPAPRDGFPLLPPPLPSPRRPRSARSSASRPCSSSGPRGGWPPSIRSSASCSACRSSC